MKYIFLFLIMIIIISGCAAENKVPVKKTNLKEDKYGSIGSKVIADNIVYSVEKVESYTEIGETEISAKASGIFYIIYLNVENKGANNHVFSPRIVLTDGIGMVYSNDLKAGFYLSNLIEWDQVLGPGESHKGTIVFDVSIGSEELELVIKDDWQTVNNIYIPLPASLIADKGISEDVLRAKESNDLLKAKIN